MAHRRAPREGVAEAARERGHRPGRGEREEQERGDRLAVVGDAGEEQHPDTGGPAHAVNEADAVGLPAAAAEPLCDGAVVLVLVCLALVVWMQVPVLDRAVPVHVGVEAAAPPAHKQADRERHYEESDQRLGGLLDPGGQVAPEQHDRQPEQQQGGGVPDSPGKAEPAGAPDAIVRRAGDQRRHCGQVVGIGGVPKTQEQGDGEDDGAGLSTGEMH